MGIKSNAGFMCKTTDGVIIGMKALLTDAKAMSKLDYLTVPLDWNEQMFSSKRKLRIGW